jgi:quercetin dioxygenase-like cupin family protein
MTNEPTSTEALKPVVVRSDEGDAHWWFGNLAVIKTTADESAGQLTIVEITAPPGLEVPLHVHHRDDEGFWILEGDVTFEVGDATIEAHASDYVFGPRDIPHRYTVGNDGCRMLFIMVPGGLEDLIRQTSQPAASRTVPPPPDGPPDPEYLARVKALGAELGYELLG